MLRRVAVGLGLGMAASWCALASTAWDGPQDNRPQQVRRIPPAGIAVGDDDRRALEIDLRKLSQAIEQFETRPEDLRADVLVYEKAVRDALAYQEFFAPADVAKAKTLLREGLERAENLRVGHAPWAAEPGPIVRGYVSKLDGSVQPYGVVVPATYNPDGKTKYRLDVWLHGRGETLSEVNFLDDRRKNPGQFTPPDTIVLHPYGRYCNANKLAGEVDVFEAIDAVRRQYRIDDERIGIRGFSMGGAGVWHLAVHFADRWYAAAPGAGFSETPRFLDVFQKEKLEPSWFERKLWRMYDCDLYAANLLNLPVVAYSGELDNQKQAADVMAEAMKPLGVELTHIIGAQTKHAYHPEARKEIDRRMDRLAARGKTNDPRRVNLVTYTLKYNRMHWLTIDALGTHWEAAKVAAEINPTSEPKTRIDLTCENVSAFTLDFPPGSPQLGRTGPITVRIDGQKLEGPPIGSDGSWMASLRKESEGWKFSAREPEGLRKRHNLQGPIDDAFMDSFIFVKPTGEESNPRASAWVEAEMTRAIEQWRRQFRGVPRVVEDSKLSDAQIAGMNLILWGDPRSNAVLAKIADKLPIAWSDKEIRVGDRTFPAAENALILIYPNPLNPSRYVVLNSGFTFREYDNLNNARQVPKLPDWAVIDLNTPPDSRYPGKIAAADFFDERWELKAIRP
ncbi:MAG: prolyl oligopeptidase family serine peptidase [Isosphaeraceae bacterium]